MAVQTVKFARSIVYFAAAGGQPRSFAHGEVVSLDDVIYPVAAWITAGHCATSVETVGLNGPKKGATHPSRARARSGK